MAGGYRSHKSVRPARCLEIQTHDFLVIYSHVTEMIRLPGWKVKTSCRRLTSQVGASVSVHRTDMMVCSCVTLRDRLQMPPGVRT